MVLDFRPVTNAPLPRQEQIPDGDWDMLLSWSITHHWMTLRIPEIEEAWAFKECAGRAVLTGVDSQVGRIKLRGSAEIDGEMLRVWRPDDAVPHKMVKGDFLYPGEDPHDRMCYMRATEEWRFLNENPRSSTYGTLTIASGYVGDICLNWLERGSHIFHDGPSKQPEPRGLIHLYDSLIEY